MTETSGRTRAAWLAAAIVVAGCDKLEGLGGSVPPLATIQMEATADPGVAGEDMQLALVWGEQWLPEALCSGLIPQSGSDTAALAAGCRDPFGFVPLQAEASVAATFGSPTTIELDTLPGSELLVGIVQSRVGYASIVLYDDVNHDGILDLARANRLGNAFDGGSENNDDGSGSNTPTFTPDVVYGASFITMTAPDTRLAYLEGTFEESAFYPRHDCSGPPPGFSILDAGGFTAQSAIAATLAGTLPPEDPADCSEGTLASTVIEVATQAPSTALAELACTENTEDSSIRYRNPPDDEPDFSLRTLACTPLPTLGGTGSGSGSGSGAPSQIELLVTGETTDSCIGLTHYILQGCVDDPNCADPMWDHSLAPPTWWPCPVP